VLLRHDATGLRAGKAAEEGAPSQKTCRPSSTEPLAEGGFVFKRPLALLVAAAAVLAVSPLGLSARSADPLVRVRVEGRTTTIFGSTQPRAQAGTALDALEIASRAGEFYYHVQESSYGRYVDQVGRYSATGSSGWVFKVNGVSPPVGADKVELKAGDVVLWYWAMFSEKGGPPTLRLDRVNPSCYRVFALDDMGVTVPPAGAVLHADGRSFSMQGATQGAVRCLRGHRSLVRATAPGMIRSNALP
jgi:hypothetical protein